MAKYYNGSIDHQAAAIAAELVEAAHEAAIYEAAKAAVPEAIRLAGQATSLVNNFYSLVDTAAKVESTLVAPLREAAAEAAEAANAAEHVAADAKRLMRQGCYYSAQKAAELVARKVAEAEAAIPDFYVERARKIVRGEIIYLAVYQHDSSEDLYSTDTGIFGTPFRTRAEAEKSAGPYGDVVPMIWGEETQISRVQFFGD